MLDGSAGWGPAAASAAPESLAGDARLHVVFGTGQVGRALAACLAGRGLAVRAVSRHRPPGLADGIDWRAADATDVGAASAAAHGAAVVYQCLLGVGMIVALILDATLVRMLLVPATMRLVGDANWWAPAPLCRFYARHGIREDDGPAPGAAARPVPEPVGTK